MVGQLVEQPIVTRQARTVAETDRIRHVDQLSPEGLEQFLALREGGSLPPNGSLEVGEVVVFDEYYRIEQA